MIFESFLLLSSSSLCLPLVDTPSQKLDSGKPEAIEGSGVMGNSSQIASS